MESRRLRPTFARLAAAAVAAAGAFTLTAWLLGFPAAAAFFTAAPPMAPSSGLCFILCGVSLWALAPEPDDARRRAGAAAAGAAALIAAWSLYEGSSGPRRGLDDLLLGFAGAPERMSRCSALAILSAALSLLLVSAFARWPVRPCELFAGIAAGFGFLALAGYAFGREEIPFPGRASITGIPPPTALALLVLSAGLFTARAKLGLAAVVSSPRLGGFVVRRLLAVCLLLIPLLAAAAIYGQRAGRYTAGDAVALTTGFSLAVVLAAVLVNARTLNRIDLARETAEEHSLALLEQLRLTVAELQAYSYTVSHNLRAPLRSIEGYAALIERTLSGGGSPTKDTMVMLRRISDSARRLDGMIKDLLTYGVGATPPVPLEAVDLDEIFAHESRYFAEVRPGALKVSGQLGKVRGQPSLVHRAIEVLLDNAVKSIPPDRAPRVEVRCEEREGGLARLVIEDNGGGIPPERLERIFDPRPSGVRSPGVGLGVVQRSIARLGGRLGAESTPGRGSRFWIELPRA